jgi:hypothetical protein
MAWAQHQTDFYNKVWSSVQAVAQRIGVSADIIFAQLALESNWGRSELTRTANNFGGIKAVGNQPYVVRRTREVFNGVSTYIQAKFRKYETVQEGIEGYGRFITENPRYRAFINATNLDDELKAIQASGYATDPQYSAKLRSVIRNMPFQQSGASGAENTVGRILGGSNPLLGAIWGGIGNSGGFGDEFTDAASNVVETVSGPFQWLSETFTMRNGSRLIFIIMGIALIIISIVVLTNSKLEAPALAAA